MAYFREKEYQLQVLASVKNYFIACHQMQSPALAFYEKTNVAYHALQGFDKDMPYFCLRVPTGGGKTLIAASSIAMVNKHFLRDTEHSVILWLVPSTQIKEQTLKGLKDSNHPLREALSRAGAVTVLSLDEAKSVTPATLNTSTTIIVATRWAFQVGNEENRKVYESNGGLMAHFNNLTSEQWQSLLADGETVPRSLVNVLRLRRPFVIIDEAHNSRTELGFDTLAKFNPSGIMELTATPDMEKTPSNVLHSVSALELKLENMIKLPIRLEHEPHWQQCLADAIKCRNDLQVLADKEYLQGKNYLRPLVLIQAQPKKSGVETLDVYKIKQELITNHAIPEHEIVVATGEEKGLSKLANEYANGIMDKNCPAKFVITQQALAEGWDCSYAYILASMANLQSSTAVEQLLGRILRQPDAIERQTPELNQSYAFVVSRDFNEVANALRDSLVNSAGFERKEVGQFLKPFKPNQFDLERFKDKKIPPIEVKLTEQPDLTQIPKTLKQKVTWNKDNQVLTVNSALTVTEEETLKNAVQEPQNKNLVEEIAAQSRSVAIEHFQTPAERGIKLRIPQLAIYWQQELQLFDDPQMLDYPWDLSRYPAKPSENEINRIRAAFKVEGGAIDISETGRVNVLPFVWQLQRSLNLVYQPEHWDSVKLATWFCSNIPDNSSTHPCKLAFVTAWLQALLESFSLVKINQQKFLIRGLLEQHLNELRRQAIKNAYQETLFEQKQAVVGGDYFFEFPPYYSPSRYYDANNSKYPYYEFRNHYYSQIGDFDSKEEFECACYLDRLAAEKKIKTWVRNLSRGSNSFYLQKATDKFYPDFVCLLPDESFLVVEYKGADRWKDAEDDRLIGGLWASLSNLSNRKCKFVMVKDKNWAGIDNQLD